MLKRGEDDSSSRKRKKTSSASTNADIYEKLVKYEEMEAHKRNEKTDSKLFVKTCEKIRQCMTQIGQLKHTPETPETRKKIENNRISVNLSLMLLKKLNRIEKMRMKNNRDAFNKERARVDSVQLQMYNLLYEVEHLKEEITKCLQFRSKDEEIDLIPVEEFYKNAPAEISRPEITKSDEHQLRLARLEYELKQCKQQSNECKQLESHIKDVAQQINNEQERLNKLGPQLQHLLNESKPVQDFLNISVDHVHEQHKLAYLLPSPLFLLYFQADAYNQVNGKLSSVCIYGDEDEARQLKGAPTVTDKHLPACDGIDSDSDFDEIELHENEEPLDKGERATHHRSRAVKSSTNDRDAEQREKLLKVHPLHVKLTIELNDNDVKQTIKKNSSTTATLHISFHYLVQLKVVVVKCDVVCDILTNAVTAGDVLSKDNMFDDLFDDDCGTVSPNPTNVYQLKHVGIDSFTQLITQLGRAYMWAQKICGLNFLDVNAVQDQDMKIDKHLSECAIPVVIKAVTRRFKARVALAKQIKWLEDSKTLNLSWNVPQFYKDILPPPDTNLSQCKCSFESWKTSSVAELRECAAFNSMYAEYIGDEDIFFKMKLKHAPFADITAYVAIKKQYPRIKPILFVEIQMLGDHVTYNADNCDAIRDLERYLNTDWPDNTRSDYWLLTYQLKRMMIGVDIFLETTDPDKFPQDKVYFKLVKGRNRARPFKFVKIGNGAYQQ